MSKKKTKSARLAQIIAQASKQFFFSRLTLGQSFGTSRADFAWTGLRPTTRRDTHNAPPDLRRKIARPSCNRFGNFQQLQTCKHGFGPFFLFWSDYDCPGFRIILNIHISLLSLLLILTMVACICRPSTHRHSLRRQRRKEENKVKSGAGNTV